MVSTSIPKRAMVKNPSNEPIGDLLMSPEHKERYSESFENRRVISSKYLDWNYFSGCHMPFIETLDLLGLKKFVSLKGFWCPELIWAFYTTLEYHIRDRKLFVEVRGIKIELSEEKMAEILGIPPLSSTDFCFTNHHNSLNPSFYGKAEVYKTITRERAYTRQEIRVSKMDSLDRQLLSVISHIVFNKSGNLAYGSEPKFLTMACFIQQ